MKFFKKRAVAVILAVVVVLAAGVISAKSGLEGAIREVEMLYYQGVRAEDGNYLRPSIDSQMRVKYNTVNSILGILAGYEALTSVREDLEAARDYVYSYLTDYNDYTIRGMAWANQELETVVARLRVEITQVDFTQRESEMLEQCLADLQGAQGVIDRAGYNEAVRDFNATEMQRFPAKALLELFGNYRGGASYFS